MKVGNAVRVIVVAHMPNILLFYFNIFLCLYFNILINCSNYCLIITNIQLVRHPLPPGLPHTLYTIRHITINDQCHCKI